MQALALSSKHLYASFIGNPWGNNDALSSTYFWAPSLPRAADISQTATKDEGHVQSSITHSTDSPSSPLDVAAVEQGTISAISETSVHAGDPEMPEDIRPPSLPEGTTEHLERSEASRPSPLLRVGELAEETTKNDDNEPPIGRQDGSPSLQGVPAGKEKHPTNFETPIHSRPLSASRTAEIAESKLDDGHVEAGTNHFSDRAAAKEQTFPAISKTSPYAIGLDITPNSQPPSIPPEDRRVESSIIHFSDSSSSIIRDTEEQTSSVTSELSECSSGLELSVYFSSGERSPTPTQEADQPVTSVNISNSTFAEVQRDLNVYNGGVTNYNTKNISRTGVHWPALSKVVSPGAAYDSEQRNPPPRCHPGTRTAILTEIDKWAKDGNELYWLHAPAGAGKSAIAQTIAESCAQRGELAASFFFAQSVPKRNNVKYLFPTIAVQMALSSSEKRERIRKVLDDEPFIMNRAGGAVDLIVQLFNDDSPRLSHMSDAALAPFLVIIDGLDECEGNRNQSWILDRIFDLINEHRLPLRFLIVSRPEPHIREAFERPVMARMMETMSLHGDNDARRDIMKYLRSEFARIHSSEMHKDSMQFVPGPWPSDATIKRLVAQSGGFFIYASTVVRFVDEEYSSCTDQLDQVLGISLPDDDSPSPPFAELDKLYTQILASCPKARLPLLKRILGFLTFQQEKQSPAVSDIETCLGLRPGQVMSTLRGLHSLISFPMIDFDYSSSLFQRAIPQELPRTPSLRYCIRSFHVSFLEFLADKDRAAEFHIDNHQWYESVFRDAFRAVRDKLHLSVNVHNSGSAGGEQLLDHSIVYPFLGRCLRQSPNQMPLVEVIRRSLDADRWSECLEGGEDWTDCEKFQAVELLIGITQVLSSLKERFSSSHQFDFVDGLNALCDSAFRVHLSLLADSPEKVERLHAMYTVANHSEAFFGPDGANLMHFLESGAPRLLEIPESKTVRNICRFMSIMRAMHNCDKYLNDFKSDPTRSAAFYYDPGVWNAFVATRFIRSLIGRPSRSPSHEASFWTNPQDPLYYASFHVYHHIEHARPNDEALMSEILRLEDFPTSSLKTFTTLRSAVAVVHWLEQWANPREDMISIWKARVVSNRGPKTGLGISRPLLGTYNRIKKSLLLASPSVDTHGQKPEGYPPSLNRPEQPQVARAHVSSSHQGSGGVTSNPVSASGIAKSKIEPVPAVGADHKSSTLHRALGTISNSAPRSYELVPQRAFASSDPASPPPPPTDRSARLDPPRLAPTTSLNIYAPKPTRPPPIDPMNVEYLSTNPPRILSLPEPSAPAPAVTGPAQVVASCPAPTISHDIHSPKPTPPPLTYLTNRNQDISRHDSTPFNAGDFEPDPLSNQAQASGQNNLHRESLSTRTQFNVPMDGISQTADKVIIDHGSLILQQLSDVPATLAKTLAGVCTLMTTNSRLMLAQTEVHSLNNCLSTANLVLTLAHDDETRLAVSLQVNELKTRLAAAEINAKGLADDIQALSSGVRLSPTPPVSSISPSVGYNSAKRWAS